MNRQLFLIIVLIFALQIPPDLQALDIDINPNFVCRSVSGVQSLLKRMKDGTLRTVSFVSVMNASKKKRLSNQATIRSLSASLSRLKGKAKTRAKKKIRSLKSAVAAAKTLEAKIRRCRAGTLTPTPDPTSTPDPVDPGSLVQPADFVYQGAFRLPGDDTPPGTFAYGGNAMTFSPDGDTGNTDSFTGSLFIMGHDRQSYGTLPDGGQIAEISIPVPVISNSVNDLPTASMIQEFQNPTAGHFTDQEEIPRTAMQYLNHPSTGPLIHLAWGQHLQSEVVPSLAWFSPALSSPQFRGTWYLGSQDLYRVTGYMMEIPDNWADVHASGGYIGVGRARDGGQGGMGPSLFAYRPWASDGSPYPSGTHINETTLLLYENAYNTDQITRCMTGYQHTDEWEGAAWITTASGKAGVLFSGNKSNGTKYWYGFRNSAGANLPCVHAESIGEFRVCIQSDGTDCPPSDLGSCSPTGERGWWATSWQAQLILYNPADFASVAAGSMASWEPQPYATINIEDFLFHNPAGIDIDSMGEGVQRRFKVGSAAFDRASGMLYVLELFADGPKPVVHVWRVS